MALTRRDFVTGAAAAGAYRVAERLGPGKRIVTVFPDNAERYLSQGIFDHCSST